jgi:hypothetical protein
VNASDVLGMLAAADGAAVNGDVPPLIAPIGAGTFLARTFPEPRVYVDGILSDDGPGFLAGEEKLGKSWYMLEEGSSLATSTPVAGRFAVPESRRVTIFAEEDSPRRTQRRLRAVLRGKGIDPDDGSVQVVLDRWLRICVWSGFNLDLPQMVVELRAHCAEFHPEVVYIDCLRKITARDLNKAAEASALLAVLDEIRREFNVTFRLVHHYRKQQGGFRSGRGSQEIGGSFVLGAWAENSLFFEPIGRKQGAVKISVQCKDLPPSPDFTLRITFEGPAHDPVSVRLQVEEVAPAPAAAEVDELVYQAIATAPTVPAKAGLAGVPVDSVATVVKKCDKTVRDSIRRLLDAERCLVVGFAAKQKKLYGVKTNANT